MHMAEGGGIEEGRAHVVDLIIENLSIQDLHVVRQDCLHQAQSEILQCTFLVNLSRVATAAFAEGTHTTEHVLHSTLPYQLTAIGSGCAAKDCLVEACPSERPAIELGLQAAWPGSGPCMQAPGISFLHMVTQSNTCKGCYKLSFRTMLVFMSFVSPGHSKT